MVPEGREEVIIAIGAGAMVSEIEADLFWAGLDESATAAVKLKVPLAVGVPEMRPVDAARLRPAGSEPEVIDQV